MGFRVIGQKRPSYSGGAVAAVVALAALLLAMAAAFAYLLVTGRGSDYVLGTLLAFEFLVAGVEVVLYARYFVGFREVSEERDEEMLW
ncbi:MAG: hypothetical protein P8Y66_06550 [Nitrospirota bacterium]